MMVNEMVKFFLDSRKRGVSGARKKCADKTLRVYSMNLELFTDFLSDLPDGGVREFKNVRKVHLIGFLDLMDAKVIAKRWSRATVLQHLRSLKAFFRWIDKDEDCQEEGLHGLQKYLPSIEKTPRRMDMPQLSDVKKFKNNFDTDNKWHFRDYVVTCLLLTNGLRIGEICSITLENLKFEDQLLIVSGKTGTRLVPITTDAVKLLKNWLKRRQTCTFAHSPYVFVSKRGPKMCQDAFTKAFARHRKKFNLPRISAHSFRHLFCTHYLRQGGDIEKLRNITGHSSYEMLKDYLHMAKIGNQAAREELEKVNLLKEV